MKEVNTLNNLVSKSDAMRQVVSNLSKTLCFENDMSFKLSDKFLHVIITPKHLDNHTTVLSHVKFQKGFVESYDIDDSSKFEIEISLESNHAEMYVHQFELSTVCFLIGNKKPERYPISQFSDGSKARETVEEIIEDNLKLFCKELNLKLNELF